MTTDLQRPPRLPPRWVIRLIWQLHRGLIRVTGGRLGLWHPTKSWGTLRLTTTGRRTGQQRHVVLGYLEDGPNLVTLAMNGWDPAEPAWWLNLQSNPDAEVSLPDGTRAVRARAAAGEERTRLWAAFRDYPGWGGRVRQETSELSNPLLTPLERRPRPDFLGHYAGVGGSVGAHGSGVVR